jgi:hypothetical protein
LDGVRLDASVDELEQICRRLSISAATARRRGRDFFITEADEGWFLVIFGFMGGVFLAGG